MKGIPVNKVTRHEILDRVKNGERVTELAKEFDLSTTVIYHWIGAQADNTPSSLAVGKMRRECEDLKKIIGTLTLELSRTKKKKPN